MILETRSPGRVALAALAALTVLAAGCANQSKTQAPPVAEAPPPAPAPVAPPPPTKPQIASTGPISYAQVLRAVQQARGDEAKLAQALNGKDLSTTRVIKLRKDAADSVAVKSNDPVRFLCEPEFTGGQIASRVVQVEWSASTRQAILQLDRCGPAPKPAPMQAAPAAAPTAPAAAAAPAAAGAAAAASRAGAKPGMDAQGNVIDSTKIEAGSGRTVKGINDYEGEITGNPAPGSKFTQLQIGMSLKQVTDIVGQPTDQGAYVTGKAFIPFYFGGDRTRIELAYKGQGRLIFAGGNLGNISGGNLTWIIHNANDTGYR